MYLLTEKQIDYILNDIKLRGVGMEDLQLNLLDHICCIIEQSLEENGDFEAFYTHTIKTFYKKELCEIEEETHLLLTFKNYYAMKKVMIISGALSVAGFITGSFFKIMHWPGASFFLFSSLLIICFVFLPLMFLLKAKETKTLQNTLIAGSGVLAGILFCLGVFFRMTHMPGTLQLWLTAIGISFFIFIPLYFFNGIRNPETKTNTIVSTVLIVIAIGIQFLMINIRPAKNQTELKMYSYMQYEDLVKQLQPASQPDSGSIGTVAEINTICEEIKALILEEEIGHKAIPTDFEQKKVLIDDGSLGGSFLDDGKGSRLFANLRESVLKYNNNNPQHQIPVTHSILDTEFSEIGGYNNLFVLNSITQLQLYLATSQNRLLTKQM
jgi:hypothetical protein